MLLALWSLTAALPGTAASHVAVIRVAGSINPASADYIRSNIEMAEREGAAALLLELDTPGGLVSSTKDIIQAILNAELPILVYVAPEGAWAGSAGTYITIAGHVAAMAPGSSIGAAHPVGVGGGGGGAEDEEKGQRDVAGEKAENLLSAYAESIAKRRNRNVEWVGSAVRESVAVGADEALELKVIDFVVGTRRALLEQCEGRKVEVAGESRILALRTAALREQQMTFFQSAMHVLASPDLAVLLLTAGMLCILIEFTNPGLLVPGIVGATCFLFALFSLQILPFSWLGLLLFMAGVGLVAAELWFSSYGLLAAAGAVLLLLGGSALFDVPELSDLRVSFWPVLFPLAASCGGFGLLAAYGLARGRSRPQVAGIEGLLGAEGVAESAIPDDRDAVGRVRVGGEYWNATADEALAPGTPIEVFAVEGLRLRVRRRLRR